MKVLFIGGTGVVSMDAVKLAVKRGFDVTVLNRGKSKMKVQGVKTIIADIKNDAQVAELIRDKFYDVIIDCITFEPNDMRRKLELFRDHYYQWIYISSCAAYLPGIALPIREKISPTGNPTWEYGRGKSACEAEIEREHLLYGANYTTIRPSETYNDYRIPGVFVANPHYGGYTILHRMRTGKPVLVMDDGNSLCPFLHSIDMARAIVGIFMNEEAMNRSFHITSDEAHSWREVTEMVAQAAGAQANIVYVPYLELAKEIPYTPLGDTYGVMTCKHYSCVFDNSAIKSVVPDFKNTISLAEGLKRVVAFYDAHNELKTIDENLDVAMDRVAAKYQS